MKIKILILFFYFCATILNDKFYEPKESPSMKKEGHNKERHDKLSFQSLKFFSF